MPDTKTSRRDFIKRSSLLAGGAFIPTIFHVGKSKPKLDDTLLGHGDFQYRVHTEWGNLNPENTPVKNCHEMVMDSNGRLIMITDETQNNIIIYDKSGTLLDSWGDQFPGGHGLTLFNEGGEDVLFITDFSLEKVFKTTTDGQILMTMWLTDTVHSLFCSMIRMETSSKNSAEQVMKIIYSVRLMVLPLMIGMETV